MIYILYIIYSVCEDLGLLCDGCAAEFSTRAYSIKMDFYSSSKLRDSTLQHREVLIILIWQNLLQRGVTKILGRLSPDLSLMQHLSEKTDIRGFTVPAATHYDCF